VAELLNSNDEVIDTGAVGAVDPFTAVHDAVNFSVEADGTALGDVSLYRVKQRVVSRLHMACKMILDLAETTYISGALDAVP
jgi:hypothetical protein